MVLGYYGGIRKLHSLCARFASSAPANRLVVRLVSADSLGAVEVRVDARVELVQHVAVVGSSSGVAVAAADGGTRVGTVGAGQTSTRSTVSVVSAVSSSQTRASGASVGAGAVLASADAASTSGVASCAIAVRVDTRVGLVGKVR